MLKKINRLTKKKEFENVHKKGRPSFDKIMGVKTVGNELKLNRFGIIVSIKISKQAVIRNKVKRRLREAVRLEIDDLKPGNDIIIITLPLIKSCELKDISDSLKKHFYRLYLYKTKR
ncbi:ribonuclease P protein component [Candidatus Falkowbacteria bacterium RIFOXYB2_FULL_47_14]|uniref:Ribonuclease P protein component n=1 Tax=Candidatus Falkowbacteria bacterium RIFOXYA2_FULL_47_19 TaxID=1797994 RepID=A0A1F5SGI9_9BACT|nr:MAG: ribonuclease P protein component [Candidatus Falkowbacteria bacterium RIFOXYA2_FULL_47_19]OGF34914.1 MAG: ribonuclease P protein component [Candidatus Falkowbacteria bacterium RIFOXYC2_FULL_46_15]OGF43629.1 MAG: ribonuclease P protein component [Candidatus Falkowbacteria bacterium RIFOXYB2_FULL_47_14]